MLVLFWSIFVLLILKDLVIIVIVLISSDDIRFRSSDHLILISIVMMQRDCVSLLTAKVCE